MDETALQAIDARLVDLGRRIRALLAADLETYFVETVRERFVRAPGAEPTDDDLRRLKARTRAAASEASAALGDRLAADAVWTTARRPETAEPPISAHPTVAEAMTDAERRLAALLAELGHADEPAPAWRLPVRFIDGESLPVLTRSYWKTLARRAGTAQQAERRDVASAADARRRRWEEA